MKVEVSVQVRDFVRRQPPDARKLLRDALRKLALDRGDIKALEHPLSGYCRLRVKNYRVVIHYAERGRIECIFAERRSVVYDVFAERLREQLRGKR